MIWFYFLILIPLICAGRRFDEPNQYNVVRGNKPILRMAPNADYSESEPETFRSNKKRHASGTHRNTKDILETFRPHKKRHRSGHHRNTKDILETIRPHKKRHGNGAHPNTKDILGEDTRTTPPPEVKGPGSMTDWDRFVKWFSNQQNRDVQMLRDYTMMDGEDRQLHVVHNSNDGTREGETFHEPSKGTEYHGSGEQPSNSNFGLKGQWDRFVQWCSSLPSKALRLPWRGEDSNLDVMRDNDKVTTKPPETETPYYYKYFQENKLDIRAFLFWFFIWDKGYPSHVSQVYEGFNEGGKLVLRKATKDIDISKLNTDDFTAADYWL